MWFVLVVAALFALMVLAAVSTARRNRRGMPTDGSSRRAAHLEFEADMRRRSHTPGGGM